MNDIIKYRRSVRRYLEQPVEREKLETLLRAGMQAPSAKNQQPWQFLVVTDKEAIKAVSEASPYAGFAANAPALIITLANMNRCDKYNWWVSDMAACTENILLQAVDCGLGACWCGYYPYGDRCDAVRECFNIPVDVIPYSVIAVGYPAKEAKFKDYWDAERVHWEQY